MSRSSTIPRGPITRALSHRTGILAAAFTLLGLTLAVPVRAEAVFPISEESVQAALGGREGTLVVIDTATGRTSVYNPALASRRYAPCSTFKIWNTLFGLESGLIEAPDELFYKWDGQERWLADWNRDLTLREAYQVSCVPAYQELARRIGAERMRVWIERIGYGDQDLSAGEDIFWLPATGRKTLLISAGEQAHLMARLASGDVPFGSSAQAVLKYIMTAKTSEHGILYGKTGTGGAADSDTEDALGWYVGYVERGSETYAYACLVKGPGVTGKDARAVVEDILWR